VDDFAPRPPAAQGSAAHGRHVELRPADLEKSWFNRAGSAAQVSSVLSRPAQTCKGLKPMSLLAIKLILTPLVVLLASLAARRWGDAVAGWLVGLPLTSAPVSVFLAIEQGPSFAAHAAGGSIAGVVSQAAFCIGYGALARWGVTVALAVGTLA
jgi:hypothetical protein